MPSGVVVFDDVGFTNESTVGRGLFGKELYSTQLVVIYREYIGVGTYMVSPCVSNQRSDVICLRTKGLPVIRGLRDTGYGSRLADILRRIDASLIHANIANTRYVYPVIRASQETGASLVSTIHNWHPVCPIGWKVKPGKLEVCTEKPLALSCFSCLYSLRRSSGFRTLVSNLVGFYMIRGLVKASSLVISPSKRLAEFLEKEVGVSRVVHLWNPVPQYILSYKPFLDKKPYIVFIGRLSIEKGVMLLPRIAELVKPFSLHVVGTGPLLEEIRRSKTDNMIIHGFLDEAEKHELLRKASALIVPSIWRELYGYVAVEAFSHATPVVAFSHGGPGELIEASGGGLVAKAFDLEEFASKVRELVTSQQLVRNLGLNGYRFVHEHLTPEMYGYQLRRVLEEYSILGS